MERTFYCRAPTRLNPCLLCFIPSYKFSLKAILDQAIVKLFEGKKHVHFGTVNQSLVVLELICLI